MRVSVTFSDLTEVEAKVLLAKAAELSLDVASEETTAEAKPAKRGRKPKEEVEESVEELDEEAAEESVEELDEETTEEVEDEEPAKIDEKQLATLKKALKAYADKNGKDKAIKILHKYAKVSQDVKADDFAKIMKALKI